MDDRRVFFKDGMKLLFNDIEGPSFDASPPTQLTSFARESEPVAGNTPESPIGSCPSSSQTRRGNAPVRPARCAGVYGGVRGVVRGFRKTRRKSLSSTGRTFDSRVSGARGPRQIRRNMRAARYRTWRTFATAGGRIYNEQLGRGPVAVLPLPPRWPPYSRPDLTGEPAGEIIDSLGQVVELFVPPPPTPPSPPSPPPSTTTATTTAAQLAGGLSDRA
jgi:hypothetical protein